MVKLVLSSFQTKAILSHSKEVVTPYFDIFPVIFDGLKSENFQSVFIEVFHTQF